MTELLNPRYRRNVVFNSFAMFLVVYLGHWTVHRVAISLFLNCYVWSRYRTLQVRSPRNKMGNLSRRIRRKNPGRPMPKMTTISTLSVAFGFCQRLGLNPLLTLHRSRLLTVKGADASVFFTSSNLYTIGLVLPNAPLSSQRSRCKRDDQ